MIKPTPKHFVRGRTFGIRGNMRLAIVLDQQDDNILWTWACGGIGDGNDSVADIVNACDWVGEIDMVLLKKVEG